MQRRPGPTEPVQQALQSAVADSLQAIFRGYPQDGGRQEAPLREPPFRKEPFLGVPPTQQASQGTAQFGNDDEEDAPEPLRPAETFSKLHPAPREVDRSDPSQKLGSYQVWTKDRVKQMLSNQVVPSEDLFVVGSGPKVGAPRPKSKDLSQKKPLKRPDSGVQVIDIDLSAKPKSKRQDSYPSANTPMHSGTPKPVATVPHSLRPPSAKGTNQMMGGGSLAGFTLGGNGVNMGFAPPPRQITTPAQVGEKGYLHIEAERRARKSAPHSSTGSLREARKSSARKIEEERIRLLQRKM